MSTTYISVTDTAKMVRAALKEAFPDVKFRVRTSKYAGGASMGVSWRDGPNERMVESVVDRFKGVYFDGSTDYKGSRYAMVDGKIVSFGADYIHCSRVLSRALVEEYIARYAANCAPGAVYVVGRDDDGYGVSGTDMDAGRAVRYALCRHSDRLRIEHSKTAARVIFCGNDGYSEIGGLAAVDDKGAA
jgi:hypothetical protein